MIFPDKNLHLEYKYSTRGSIVTLFLVILLSLNFLLLGIDRINTNTNPQAADTTAFLGEANLIKKQGGIKNFINLLITGQYKQANQHPLFTVALVPFASTDISFFVNAKIISAIIGFVLLLSLFIIARKMCGDLCASIAVLALILNDVLIKWTAMVACESLLMLFSLLCMYFVIEGFKNNKNWVYAGVFAGLAYLTKGTALFLIPGFGLASLIVYRFRIFTNKYFWSFFVLFVVVSSPLFIRNTIVYQNPLFNVNNYIISYGWDELNSSLYFVSNLKEGAGIWKFDFDTLKGEENLSPRPKNSNRSSVILLDLPKRVAAGIVNEIQVFLSLLNISPTQKFFPKSWELLFGIIMFSFFATGILREKNLGAKMYIILTFLVFLVCLSFFRPLIRYFLPIIPFISIYIALGMLTAWDFADQLFFSRRLKINTLSYIPYLLIILLIGLAGSVLATQSISNPLRSVDYSESRLELLNWLRANLGEDDKYTFGPNFNWQLDEGTWMLPPRKAWADFDKFDSFASRHRISYLILTEEQLTREIELPSHSGADSQMFFAADYFYIDPSEGIVEKKALKGWSLVYKGQSKPVEFLVYRLNREDITSQGDH